MVDEWVDCVEYNPYTCPDEPHQHLAGLQRRKQVHDHGREDRECHERLVGDCILEKADALAAAVETWEQASRRLRRRRCGVWTSDKAIARRKVRGALADYRAARPPIRRRH